MIQPTLSRDRRRRAPLATDDVVSAEPQRITAQIGGKRSRTRDQILAGALVAMSQRGLHKLSIEDICVASGVSRRTLYRHFDSREEVIAGVASHMRQLFEAGLARAIKARPDLDDRVMIVMEHLTSYPGIHEATVGLVGTELEFVRDSVAQSFGEYVDMIRLTVEPIFTAQPELGKAGLTAVGLAELIMRFAMQALLTPSVPHTQATETFSAYWRLVVSGVLLKASAK